MVAFVAWATPGAAPLKLQFTVAVPLSSLTIATVSATPAPPAVTVCVRLSPAGSVSATASTVNTIFVVAEVLATEVAVIVAVQLAFSAFSAGGVYVAVLPAITNVPQPAPLKFQVTSGLVPWLTVAVRVTAPLPASGFVVAPLCAMETLVPLLLLQPLRNDSKKQPRIALTTFHCDLILASQPVARCPYLPHLRLWRSEVNPTELNCEHNV
jgi:hypothetical protein